MENKNKPLWRFWEITYYGQNDGVLLCVSCTKVELSEGRKTLTVAIKHHPLQAESRKDKEIKINCANLQTYRS